MNKVLLVFVMLYTNDLAFSQDIVKGTPNGQSDYYSLGYQFDTFNRQFDNWHLLIGEAQYKIGTWKFIPRGMFGERFKSRAYNAELDIYKTFSNRDYILLSGGYSPNEFFPNTRVHFEYFKPFGKSWEYSMAIARYDYIETGSFFSAMASLSKYYSRRMLISLRGNYAFGSASDDFINYGLGINNRIYFNEQAHLGMVINYGFDNTLVVIANENAADDPYLFGGGVYYKSQWTGKFRWRLSYDFTQYNLIAYSRLQHSFKLILYREWSRNKKSY